MNRVVFFGRDVDQYSEMFSIDFRNMCEGLPKRILDSSAGPSSFTQYVNSHGSVTVTSNAIDPLYLLGEDELFRLGRRDINEQHERYVYVLVDE